MNSSIINPIIHEIREILDVARKNVAREVNNELIVSYWKIGESIVRYEKYSCKIWKTDIKTIF